MTLAKIALLPDRGAVSVRGPDAGKMLQGLITNDLESLAGGHSLNPLPAAYAALLSPQGKILFDMFVMRMLTRGMLPGDAYILETNRLEAPALVERLRKYKLRADVTIEDMSDTSSVVALWGAEDAELQAIPPVVFDASPTHFKDPRHPRLGFRWLAYSKPADRILSGARKELVVDAAEYHAHRIALGVPEAGKDYALGDTFPHEADMDQLGGVSFTKGCFVGQEVVSRMQHRAHVRKRVVPIDAVGAGNLQSGSEVMAGAAAIGKVGSVAGSQALALLRLDRAAEAKAKGEPLTAGGVAIALRKPDWATFELEPTAAAETT